MNVDFLLQNTPISSQWQVQEVTLKLQPEGMWQFQIPNFYGLCKIVSFDDYTNERLFNMGMCALSTPPNSAMRSC